MLWSVSALPENDLLQVNGLGGGDRPVVRHIWPVPYLVGANAAVLWR